MTIFVYIILEKSVHPKPGHHWDPKPTEKQNKLVPLCSSWRTENSWGHHCVKCVGHIVSSVLMGIRVVKMGRGGCSNTCFELCRYCRGPFHPQISTKNAKSFNLLMNSVFIGTEMKYIFTNLAICLRRTILTMSKVEVAQPHTQTFVRQWNSLLFFMTI